MSKLGFTVLVLALSIGMQAPLAAQTDGEYFGIFSLRSQNPGARARGLGGAFVALADDATAAFSNPAGLAYLDRWEISAEFLHDEEDRELAQRSGEESSPYRLRASSEEDSLSFASVVFPIKKGRLTGAVFFSQPANSPTPDFFEQQNSAYIPELHVPSEGIYFLEANVRSDARNRVYGVSAGLRISDRFSVGGSIGQSEFTYLGSVSRQNVNNIYRGTQNSSVDDTDLFGTVGVLFQPTDRVSLGFSWQSETSYEMNSYTDVDVDAVPESKFTIPTKWALGISFRATDSLVFSLEADRIEYADLFEGMNGETFFDPSENYASDYQFATDNVTEYHVGAEYTFFAGSVGWSLRGGYWRDEAHLPYFSGTGYIYELRQPKLDRSIDHYTAGFGLSFKHFMVDFAGDYSDYAGTDYLSSVVFRF